MTDCDHDWEDTTRAALLTQLGYRRKCTMCGIEQIWRVKWEISPEVTPELGQWEDIG